jgi:toxin ParE1/3/4
MRVRHTQAALTEIDEIFAYIAADNPDAAARVVDRIEQVVARIGEFPFMGPRSDEPDVRLIRIGRYPYLIHRDGRHHDPSRSPRCAPPIDATEAPI